MKEGNKRSWFPNVYTILFLLAIVSAILTWIVPAGSYERVTEENVTKVVAGTYHVIGQNPQGPWEIFQALVTGFKNQSSLCLLYTSIRVEHGQAAQVVEHLRLCQKLV